MNRILNGAWTTSAAGYASERGDSEVWAATLHRLLGAVDGAFTLYMPDGSSVVLGRQTAKTASTFSLRIRSKAALCTLLLGRDPQRFAHAYFRGDVDIEGDLFSAVALMNQLQLLHLPLLDRGILLFRHLGDFLGNLELQGTNAIALQEDQPNDFYRLWLDDEMVYSCAYFESDEMSLTQAQVAKLDHICCKLQLQPGEKFLDIGCGWGALALHAAQYFGVQAHGITLSKRQFEWAHHRIRVAGLQGRVKIDLLDYRDLVGQGSYDKIASVGMLEQVGLKNLPLYFQTVHGLLKPDGQFLNHGITHQTQRGRDAELDSVGSIQRTMESASFEVLDVESLRPHYAKTLRHWVQRLQEQHAGALEHVSEATYRVWLLYMAARALELESGELGIYQILVGHKGAAVSKLTPKRQYMYSSPIPLVSPSTATLQSLCELEVLL